MIFDESTMELAKNLFGIVGVGIGAFALAYYRIRHYKRIFESEGVTASASDQLVIRLQEREKVNLDRAERAEIENKSLIIHLGEAKADARVLIEKLDNVKMQLVEAHNDIVELRDAMQQRRRGDKR